MALPDLDGYQPQDMVHWYNPPNSIRTGLKVLLGVLFGPFNDRRELQAALDHGPLPFRYDDEDDIWIDFVGDLGDGWHSTYSIAWLLAQQTLTVSRQQPSPSLFQRVAPALWGSAKDTRAAQAKETTLHRGRVLVMGGDTVYPTASEDNYLNHTQVPYECALPGRSNERGPDLFAIPGNHDWYDGLPSFLRLFCQKDHIGGWHTRQSRSYFALQLPHRWWLWGIDTQLEAEIDYPQRQYFEKVAKHVRPGDRIILCLHKPAWLYLDRQADEPRPYGPHEALATIEEKVIKPCGATVAVMIAGHQHHYCRYESLKGATHRITSGGGGAYLHGTHTLESAIPVRIPAKGGDRFTAFMQASAYPDPYTSKNLRWRNVGFARRNLIFSWWILGSFYLLHAGFLLSANVVIDTPDDSVSLFDSLVNATQAMSFQREGWMFVPQLLMDVLNDYWNVLRQWPQMLVFPLFLWLCLAFFCAPPERWTRWRDQSNTFSFAINATVGGLHALAHTVLNLWLIAFFLHLNIGESPLLKRVLDCLGDVVRLLKDGWSALWLWLYSTAEHHLHLRGIELVLTWLREVIATLFGWLGHLISFLLGWVGAALTWVFTYQANPHGWWQHLVFGGEMIVIGGLAAGTLLGLYLVLANWFRFHEDSAFSSLRIPDYKNFLRLHIGRDGLRIYPIGVDKACQKWRASRTPAGHLRVTPMAGKIPYHLIEEPIIIPDPVLPDEGQKSPLGVGLMFTERMSGALKEEQAQQARVGASPLEVTVTFKVLIPDLDAFLCDERHPGILRGDLTIPQLSALPITNAKGGVELFAPDGNTPRKLLHYWLTFMVGIDEYHLDGNKIVEDDPGFDIWKDTTTLHTTLFRDPKGNNALIASGPLTISLWGVLKSIFSFTAFNEKSWREEWQAYGVYLGFFAAELWDVYVRRVKGFFVRYLVISWLIFGGFYLLHAWSIEAGSQQTFMKAILEQGWSLWMLLEEYRAVYLESWWIVLFPLALLVTLTSVPCREGTPNWLGLSYFQFYPSWWERLLGIIHAGVQLLVNLVLIWVIARVIGELNRVLSTNAFLSTYLRPLSESEKHTLFFLAMLVIGGTFAGLIYSWFRHVKLVRPYAG